MAFGQGRAPLGPTPYAYTHARTVFGPGASAVLPATIYRRFGIKGKAQEQKGTVLACVAAKSGKRASRLPNWIILTC
jgi:hypothetical protein